MLKRLAELPADVGGFVEGLANCSIVTVEGAEGDWQDPIFYVNVAHRRRSVILHRPYHLSFAVNSQGWALMCGMYFNHDCLLFMRRVFAGVEDIAFAPRLDHYGGSWEFGYPNRSVALGYGMDLMLSGLWKDDRQNAHSMLYMDDHPLYEGDCQ